MVKLTYLGHAGFFVDFGQSTVLIDPVVNFPKHLKPIEKPQIKKKILDNAQILLITNSLPDHFDKKLVEEIAEKNRAAIVGPPPVIEALNLPRNVLFNMNSNGNVFVRGINIQSIPAHNPHVFYPLSYLIKQGEKKIYHGGNTQLTDLITKIKAEVVLLPIGGKMCMDINDAVRATKLIKPKFVVPMRYNTFEEIVQNPKEMVYKLKKSKINSEVAILKPGKSLEF